MFHFPQKDQIVDSHLLYQETCYNKHLLQNGVSKVTFIIGILTRLHTSWRVKIYEQICSSKDTVAKFKNFALRVFLL